MELNWKLDRIPRPGSATVRVTDLGWQGFLNPSPSLKDDEELLVDEYLSPNKLRTLTGLDELQLVKALEMRVDTRQNSLGNFGAYLPNLKQLKLNNSILTSVRDLGTALSNLQVLWMARCGLPDLDGISSCHSLKELYIAYNNIADLSQLSFLEYLEILDLEGNNIEDLNQIQYLGLCTKLSTLTVEGNFICLKPNPQSSEVPDYNYRAEIKKLIPHLKCLDEIPASQTALPFPCKMNKDWLMVKESIKDGNFVEEAYGLDSLSGPVTRKPCSTVPTNFLSASRPQTAQRSPSANLLSVSSTLPESTICDEALPEDDSSDLTHGISRVICGNPIKALHARRQKLGPAVMNLPQPQRHIAENNCDTEETVGVNGEDILAKLKTWREHHYQFLQTLQREKTPQVLEITHSEEGEEDYGLSDSFNEDLKAIMKEDVLEKMSSDSSYQSRLCQSSSDSSHSRENVLPSIIKHPLVPSPPKCPSPAATKSETVGLFRARRLNVPSLKKAASLEPFNPSTVNGNPVQHVVEETAVLSLCGKPDASSSASEPRLRPFGSDSKQTRRPISGPAAIGSTNIRPTVDRSLHKMISLHHPVVRSCTKPPERFSMLNVPHPLTTKAALQSLPSRPNISMMAPSKTPK